MKHILGLVITALIAGLSSLLTARLQIPVWTMFAGWIAFVAGGMSARIAVPATLCALIGVLLGCAGALLIGTGVGGPDLSLVIGVFVIVLAALLAQHLPVISLVICYFIGMTTFFASGLPPQGSTVLLLGAGLLLGVLSGLIAVTIAGRMSRAPDAATG